MHLVPTARRHHESDTLSVVPATALSPSRKQRALPSEHSLRRINHQDPEDRKRVLTLLEEYFADTPEIDAAARYAWLYLENPAGEARTYAACVGETAVGVTSLFPRAVLVGGKRMIGSIGGDGYVTPAHRRRGIVTALHREAHTDMNDQLSFMFGPPEPNNLRALLQAGASLAGNVRRYTRALSSRGLGKRAASLPFMHSIDWLFRAGKTELQVERVGKLADARIEAVWRATKQETELRTQILPVADAAFYAWRFGAAPSGRQYAVVVRDGETPIGAAALEEDGDRVAILEVTCCPGDFRRVVHALLASVAHADQVSIQIHLPSAWKELALHSLGFVSRETKAFQVQLQANHPARDLLISDHAWNYMWGDGDLDRLWEERK